MDTINRETKKLKNNRISELKGILVPNSKLSSIYKILGKYGTKYKVNYDPLLAEQLKYLSWEHVVASGVFNKSNKSVDLLFIFKDKSVNEENDYFDYNSESEYDLDFIRHEIEQNGLIQPTG